MPLLAPESPHFHPRAHPELPSSLRLLRCPRRRPWCGGSQRPAARVQRPPGGRIPSSLEIGVFSLGGLRLIRRGPPTLPCCVPLLDSVSRHVPLSWLLDSEPPASAVLASCLSSPCGKELTICPKSFNAIGLFFFFNRNYCKNSRMDAGSNSSTEGVGHPRCSPGGSEGRGARGSLRCWADAPPQGRPAAPPSRWAWLGTNWRGGEAPRVL